MRKSTMSRKTVNKLTKSLIASFEKEMKSETNVLLTSVIGSKARKSKKLEPEGEDELPNAQAFKDIKLVYYVLSTVILFGLECLIAT